MELVTPLLVTAALLLLPLVPAAIIYLLLTPREKTPAADANAAKGTIQVGPLNMQFNLVGSAATYIVLFAMAHMIYDKAEADRITTHQSHVNELAANQAWQVEVPVNIMTGGVPSGDLAPGGLSQVQLRLDPGYMAMTSNMITFWVTPNDKRFPTAWLTYPDIVQPVKLDLNSDQFVKRNYDTKTISMLAPVSLQIGSHYAAN